MTSYHLCSAADELLGEATEEFKVSQKFTETLSELPIEEKVPLGHQIEDFILECSFRGRKCSTGLVSKSKKNAETEIG